MFHSTTLKMINNNFDYESIMSTPVNQNVGDIHVPERPSKQRHIRSINVDFEKCKRILFP